MHCKNHRSNRESGQALLTGLFFLIFTLLFFSYFIYFSESVERFYQNHEVAKLQALKDSTQIANALNQIAINNQNIVTAIAEAQNAFTAATELGLQLSYHQPYWETHSIFQKTTRKDLFSNTLSEKTKKFLEENYSSYALASARGFFIAKSLSEKNSRILKSIPKNIAQFFSHTTNAQVHCLALSTQAKYYYPNGMTPLPPSLYNFYLAQKDCQISHPRSFDFLPVPKNLPFFTSGEGNNILSYQKIDVFMPHLSDIQYGIYYVPPKNSQPFILSLKKEVKTSTQSIKKTYNIVENYLFEIPFFNDLKKQKNSISNFYPSQNASIVRISHPNLICENGHPFLAEEDWEKIEICYLNVNYFLKAFFSPKWTSFLTFQETPFI